MMKIYYRIYIYIYYILYIHNRDHGSRFVEKIKPKWKAIIVSSCTVAVFYEYSRKRKSVSG